MKDIVLLQNISDKPFSFEVTENPMANPAQFSIREDAGLANPQDMEANELQQFTQKENIERAIKKNPNLKERLSVLIKVIIKPGEIVAFKERGKLNLNQAEHIYALFGGYTEYPDGVEMPQPIIEVVKTDEGYAEDKSNFYRKYRMKKSIDVVRKTEVSREQFTLPVEAKK